MYFNFRINLKFFSVLLLFYLINKVRKTLKNLTKKKEQQKNRT